jgi:Ser/Thr protein kinase RdoA (MazF antagonist)
MSCVKARPPLSAELRALLALQGASLEKCVVLTRLPAHSLSHASYRFQFADGRVLKGRQVESASQAARMHAIVSYQASEQFAKVLCVRGAALLEEWVNGEPLDRSDPGPAVVGACGAVLGALHAMPVPDALGNDAMSDAAARAQTLERHVNELEALGALPAASAARARAIAVTESPASLHRAVIHRDFCAENIVLRADGTVCVIDNETMCVDVPAFDLARTWYRWELDEGQWDALLAGYAQHRSCDEFLSGQRFWLVSALVDASLFRVRARTPHPEVPLSRLLPLLR